jgi:very-short-patch-repair endonuclease
VRTVPDKPDVTVARNRRLSAEQRRDVNLHWADLADDDLDGHRTSADRTLVDCLRSLPLPEALAVADSALREGMSGEHLLAVARDARGPGSPRIRHVASLADGRAKNPFESSLRAICFDVDGLEVVPQVPIYDPHWLGRPDLVDVRLRIVLEADSFEWHGSRHALKRDARRYNALVAAGWLVLRFSWEDVMFEPELVAETLRAVVKRRTEVLCSSCTAA